MQRSELINGVSKYSSYEYNLHFVGLDCLNAQIKVEKNEDGVVFSVDSVWSMNK